MQARADERVVRAEQRAADARAEVESARSVRASESTLSWAESRARALGEVHEDLVSRAEALGIPLPSPDRQMRGRGLAALGELVVRDGSGVEGGTVDAYEAWRDRIIVEESMVAKQARGESLSLMDRAALKAARFGSR